MTTERFWEESLAEIDFTPLDNPEHGQWRADPDILNSAESLGRWFSISNGLVDFDLWSTGKISMMKWNAKLPEYLRPENIDQYMELVYWLLIRLPSRLYPDKKRPALDYRQSYEKHSSVDLFFEGGQGTHYYFSDETLEKKLALDLITRRDAVRTVLVRGTESPLLSFKYRLRVDRNGLDDSARVTLTLPNNPPDVAPWNPRVVEWMIGMHRYRDKLGDLEAESLDLSRVIYEKVGEVTRQNTGAQE